MSEVMISHRISFRDKVLMNFKNHSTKIINWNYRSAFAL
jgi:hypothetical protein